jgi:hypothetical protein
MFLNPMFLFQNEWFRVCGDVFVILIITFPSLFLPICSVSERFQRSDVFVIAFSDVFVIPCDVLVAFQ